MKQRFVSKLIIANKAQIIIKKIKNFNNKCKLITNKPKYKIIQIESNIKIKIKIKFEIIKINNQRSKIKIKIKIKTKILMMKINKNKKVIFLLRK